ncbi:hypothetical protein GGR56DRAFT_2881 [Xylariaceae sp. FL0804]|nr:hypothetical protein GGR56DRAFT_2881 [Xylariaceae sp. FL0804]
MATATDPARLQEADDEDDISITSTIFDVDPINEENEYAVENVLAERRHPEKPDVVQYLIKWDRYPLEESTWEPVEHIEDLLEEWERAKEAIQAGERPRFDVEEYENARKEKLKRHLRRNNKRKRLGFTLTPPFDSAPATARAFGGPSMPSVEGRSSSSEDEAAEDDYIDPGTAPAPVSAPAPAPAPAPAARPVPKQTMFKGIPSQPARVELGRDRAAENVPPAQRALQSGALSKDPKPPVAGTSSKASETPRQSGGTMTGYQGTARKPNNDRNLVARLNSANRTAGQPTPSASKQQPSNAPDRRPQPQKSSSNLAMKFGGRKQMVATKSSQKPLVQAASSLPPLEAFQRDPPPRKKRANIVDVAADSTKAPKHFTNMHIQYVARKRAIERQEASVGSFSSIPSHLLLNPTSSPATTPAVPPSGPVNNAPAEAGGPANVTRADTSGPASVAPAKASGERPAAVPKRKKSVRFSEVADEEPRGGDKSPDSDTSGLFLEPQNIDKPVERPPDTPATSALAKPGSHAPLAPRRSELHPRSTPKWAGTKPPSSPKRPGTSPPPPPAKRLSLSDYLGRGQTQAVAKTLKLGASKNIRVLFHGISRQSDPWLSAFMAHDRLDFDKMCSPQNFFPMQGKLVADRLSAGAVEAASLEHVPALVNAAAWFKQDSVALHLLTPEYSILLYPNDIMWKDFNNDVEMGRLETPLRYMIYRSPVDRKLYPPMSSATRELGNSLVEQPDLLRQTIVKDLAQLRFESFLPQDINRKHKQVYMLLIPNREKTLSMIIKLWLRSCQPNCRIFSNEYQSSWVRFHETVQGEGGVAGTIIIHADVTWELQKIPGIWRLLQGNTYTFWDLATAVYDPPKYPSPLDATFDPGTLQMTRLFPFGRVFLITPSFVLSDPTRLCYLLEWFLQYGSNPGFLIMACHDFPGYLRQLIAEKESGHNEYIDRNPAWLARRGWSYADVEATFRAYELVLEIIELYGDDDDEIGEDVQKVHWITEWIDQNDEQSLVNYFSFWSTTRLDRYRRFFVLGSDKKDITKAHRIVTVPRYDKVASSDPDVSAQLWHQVEAAASDVVQATEAAQDNEADAGSYQAPPIDPLVSGDRDRISQFRTAFNFPSDLLRNDRATDFHNWIYTFQQRRFDNRSDNRSWGKVHANAVSWIDPPMADQFGDDRCTFDTFGNWFHAAPPFSRLMNTWYGLFYTVNGDWDPARPQRTYGRQPWIAIYRPKNPHKLDRGFSRIELFIWDLSMRDRSRQAANPIALLDMQWRLIDFVGAEVPKKFPGCELDAVWASSWTEVGVGPDDNPVDITLRRLEELLYDVKKWLPPFVQLYSQRQWHEVSSHSRPGRATGGNHRAAMASRRRRPGEEEPVEVERVPQNEGDRTKAERMVWHPFEPAGDNKGGGGGGGENENENENVSRRGRGRPSSACRNDLHEAALRARRQDPARDAFPYEYRPTLDWYADLVRERRDNGVLQVDTAERIMRRLPPLNNK